MKRKIVSSDPEIMHGALVFAGTRVLALTLWDYLEAGDSLDAFLEDFPSVKRQQTVWLIRQASRFREYASVHTDPEILGGTPVFVGTRVPVQNLWDYLAGGHGLDYFLRGFPTVAREQAAEVIRQGREHGARCP